MKRMIVMGVLMVIATGFTPKPDATPERSLTPEPTPPTPEPIQEPESTPETTPTASGSVPEPEASAPEPQAPTTYVADTYGFSFSYPDRYFMPEQNYIDYSSDQSGTLQKRVELWQQQDYDDIRRESRNCPPISPFRCLKIPISAR